METNSQVPLDATELIELRRMLQSFKAQLPPHELGYWYITRQSPAEVIENIGPPGVWRDSPGLRDILIRGYAECVRCPQRFDIPDLANFTASDEDDIARAVDTAKGWVLRDAERSGPCWGDVPRFEEPRLVTGSW